MGHATYLVTMVACLGGASLLELGMRTRVYRRWRRLVLTVLPVVAIFMTWDAYAIHVGHWNFNPRLVTGVTTVAGIPLEELVFFVVIPICSILTFEAVRALRDWRGGDEQ